MRRARRQPVPFPSDRSEPPPRLVVLLGAGASKLADVPLTREFVTSLSDALGIEDETRPRDARLRPQYDRLLAFLEARRPKAAIDIELVYESLVRLAGQDDDVLLVGRDQLPLTKDAAHLLKGAAEKHIRAKAFVETAKTTYLDELITLRAHEPLTIFSTNYDTAIEVLAERHRLRWEDGFRVRWDPAVFREPRIDVRLHKLHGSVLWYRDQFGSYLRSPLRPHAPDPSNLTWFAGHCEPLLIYPARKSAQDAPYTYGLLRLSSLLGSRPRPVQLVVIGYSFRDQHLRQVITDAAVSNPHLSVVLVDPNAGAIYESELRGTREVPSPLADRVFCVDEGLDARGEVLRALSRSRLRDSASAFAKERSLSRESADANSFQQLARSYAWVGDRHGLARCVERLGVRGEPIAPQTVILNAALVVIVAARSVVGAARIRDAASALCWSLREQFVQVHRPPGGQEGNGFENWSFNVQLAEKLDEVRRQLEDARGFAETGAQLSTGASAAGCAVVIAWLKWLAEFLTAIHVTNDGTAHLGFPMLLQHGALTRRPSEQEYRDPTMVTAVAAALDRFFREIAPQRLVDALQVRPS